MQTKHLNILLADDDMDDCSFFKDALASIPLLTTLHIVNNGEELMEYLSMNTAQLPDLLFLDINMPRKNGIECLSEIKNDNSLKLLPVVMFSTSNTQDKIAVVFKTGADVYIHKPCDFGQLKQVILHALPIASEKTFSRGHIKYILNA